MLIVGIIMATLALTAFFIKYYEPFMDWLEQWQKFNGEEEILP